MHSCLYVGRVRHRRNRPVEHHFHYRLFMVYLDLAELDRVFRGRWLWSTRRPAPARFHRGDHTGDPDIPLDEAVRNLVQNQTGRRPAGPVRLLTHLRYFGYCFNPVSFYYCFAADGERLEAIVAEVNNTPWGERHCYVLPTGDQPGPFRYRFDKSFHVSPFMPMQIRYDWRFGVPGERLSVHMENIDTDGKLFDATLNLERRPISGPGLAGVLCNFPAMTVKVVVAIYWQALRLWLKGSPFHSHPVPTRDNGGAQPAKPL